MSALSPNGDWDGTLSVLDGKPIIFFDCYDVQDCNGSYVPPEVAKVKSERRARIGLPLDPPLVGVAHPANLSDPNLLEWKKDPRNPIAFHTADGTVVRRGFAGPSNLWRAPGEPLSFAMQLGGSIARFTSHEPSLHNWTVADASFYGSRSGHGGRGASGLAFFELPTNTQTGGPASPLPSEAAVVVATGPYTHWLGNLWVDGTPAGTSRHCTRLTANIHSSTLPSSAHVHVTPAMAGHAHMAHHTCHVTRSHGICSCRRGYHLCVSCHGSCPRLVLSLPPA